MLRNKYLIFQGSVQCLCSCWLCLFFVGASVSDFPSSFPFLFLIVVLPLLGLYDVFVMFFLLLFIFLLLCFLLFITYVILISFFFFSFSRLIILAVVFFVFVPPFFLILCFLFSPGQKEKMETTSISFCLPSRELCENILSKKSVSFSLVGVFHPQNMFLLNVVGICFKGVRESLSFHCCFVVLVFGQEPSFGPICLLCLYSLDLLSSLFVLFLFYVFLLVWCFLGSASFLWNSLRHLGIVFSSLLCPHAASSPSCLGCSCVCVGVWAAFLQEPSRGVVS